MYKTITFLITISFLVKIRLIHSGSDESDKNEKIKSKQRIGSRAMGGCHGGTLTETWKKSKCSTYNGQAYFMKGTDTIHTEKILLQQVEDELSYNTTIKGQNDDEPVSFILTDRKKRNLFLKIESITIHKKSATRRFQRQSGD
jgi:hypothetical protein